MVRTHGTPRRTVLLAGGGQAVTATATPLEVPDDPCVVMLSSAGLLARADTADPLPTTGNRAQHDVIVSTAYTSARGEYGVLTSAGRVLRAHAVELPSVVVTADAPNLQGGTLASELLDLDKGERPLALTRLGADATWALGTARGVVKRVNPEVLTNKDAWEVIRLEVGDAVVGAVELSDESSELVFVSSDAQLLHFPAAVVRPQGRSGGGMAGIKLDAGARVVFFGAVPDKPASVVTVSGSGQGLVGTEAGAAKVTDFAEYPGKGRATGGVRCHRFLKGETTLLLAWVGPDPFVGAAPSGAPIDLGSIYAGRRDGSGQPMPQPLGAVGSRTHGVQPSAASMAAAGADATPGEDVASDEGDDALF
ncbi:MAG: DNA topoisomerase IV, partial [Propionibacteriaceae bacterium]|nr:DNA topoisomerase IV [Propionibacteriaceae bacterium]